MKHRRQFPRATAWTDHHGKRRWRYQHRGRSWQLGTEYGSDEFIRRYEAALREAGEPSIGASRTKAGSLDALVAEFYRSPKFKGIGASTRATYSGITDRFRSQKERGRKLVKDLRRADVIAIM